MSVFWHTEKEVREAMKARCSHKCHDAQPLNDWVEFCPICGCANKTYDPEAVPETYSVSLSSMPDDQ